MHELEQRGAVLTDQHFVYKSGKHGSGYVNFDPAFPDVGLILEAAKQMVEPFLGEFDVVVGPATGGVALSYACGMAASFLGEVNVQAVWADKDGDGFAFERDGFIQAIRGKRVLVVDDVMTNANLTGSVFKVCQLVKDTGGTVIGVSLVCNRCSGTAEDLWVPRLEQLGSVNFTAVDSAECAATGLCYQHVPIVEDIGHGAAFKQNQPFYPGGFVKLLPNQEAEDQ